MEDIIQKYHKKKRKNTLAIIATSLALAVWLNFYVNNSNMGQMLKSSVMDSSVSAKDSADMYLEAQNDIISLKSSKNMSGVKSMSFAFVYNTENLSIKDKLLELDGVEMVELANNNGYVTLLLNFKTPLNISSQDTLLKLVVEKKDASLQESLVITQANFIDSEEKLYALTTSGLQY